MSRIGVQPVVLPEGVSATIHDDHVEIDGPKGVLMQSIPATVHVTEEDGSLLVQPNDDTREARAMWGTMRSLLQNMVTGVVDGYTKVLELRGVGYRASLQGSQLELKLGHSHPILIEPPEGITFEVDGDTITVTGIDKQLVGEIAAVVRSQRPPEPYKGKGVRYRDEVVRRKAGKRVAGGAGEGAV